MEDTQMHMIRIQRGKIQAHTILTIECIKQITEQTKNRTCVSNASQKFRQKIQNIHKKNHHEKAHSTD